MELLFNFDENGDEKIIRPLSWDFAEYKKNDIIKNISMSDNKDKIIFQDPK